MGSLVNTFKDFFGIVNSRYIIAAVIMIVVIAVVIYITSVVVKSFLKRREAVSVQLPNIDVTEGKVEEEVKGFKVEDNPIVVELIDSSEDEIDEEVPDSSDEAFIEALTMVTGNIIISDEDNIDMPEVGEIDYDKIREERQKEAIEHLKEIAKADEDLDEIDEIMLNVDEAEDGKDD